MTRRERLERKIERREDWAESRDRKAAAGFEKARTIADGIPMGQPILVGHHSEKRHRADIARIDSGMRQGVESQQMASHHRSKADGLRRQLDRSIFTDDENAIEALKERIAENEAKRDRIKAINRAIRAETKKHPGPLAFTAPAILAAVVKAGKVTEAEAKERAHIFGLMPYHGITVPAFSLTNIGARIRRDKKQIENVKRSRRAQAEAEAAPGGLIIGRHAEYDYCSVRFAEKPDREIRSALKAAGFHWGNGIWCGSTSKIPACVLEMEQAAALEVQP